MYQENNWIELRKDAVEANVTVFRALCGGAPVMAVVKANAYGHGATPVARIALEAGASWLGVFSPREAIELRGEGITAPILVMGPCPGPQVAALVEKGIRLTIGSVEAAREILGQIGATPGGRVHLKLETGTNRQGLRNQDIVAVARMLADGGVQVEGAYTHFADIEDTTDHAFAQEQLARYTEMLAILRSVGHPVPVPHTACTAAAILFPETYFSMVRVGIGLYGLWPSKETRVSAQMLGRNKLGLIPVMQWKTRIAQVREIPVGEFVGYGRTFRATRATALGVLPVGYADGYDRALGGVAHVLVGGVRAPVIGRVCMNLTMIDVTDVPAVAVGNEVVLLGSQGDETVSAEDLARWAATINYEIVTRAAPGAPRIPV